MHSLELDLVFSRLPYFGAGRYWKLREQFSDLNLALEHLDSIPTNILNSDAKALLRDYRNHHQDCSLAKQAQLDIQWCGENNIHILSCGDENYPSMLAETHRAPPIIYVQGRVELVHLPQISIVGSRHCSKTGLQSAKDFACFFASNGLSVTSGLALGVDAAAHWGALAAKNEKESLGSTIAVLGSGIDKLYPRANQKLAEKILEKGGAIVSEFPLGTAPSAQNFPQRNRIISGLSYGTLVIEAAIKSGSLITAKYALEQNREVFAIPGSIHHPLSRGCHALIKQGAKLVETAQDVVDELGGFLSAPPRFSNNKQESEGSSQKRTKTKTKENKTPSKELFGRFTQDTKSDNSVEQNTLEIEHPAGSTEALVLEYLGYEPTPIDTLVYRTGLQVQDLMAALLTLELSGLIANEAGGYMRFSDK